MARPVLKETELRALAIALDELEAYVDTVGIEDEANGLQVWSVRVLQALKKREEEARYG